MPVPVPIRIFLVDDHPMVRVGLRTLLQNYHQLEVVGEAGTAAEALNLVPKADPHVVLLDIRLPDQSGLHVCRQLHILNPSLRALMLTSYDNEDLVIDAMVAGAKGYLLKEVGSDVLVQSILDIMEGRSVFDLSVSRAGLDRERSAINEGKAPTLDVLSPQERRVIALVAEGRTNKEIGTELRLSDKTVKNYLSNLMEKLKFTRRSQAAVFYARQVR